MSNKTTLKRINLNYNIHVKLDENGVNILKRYYGVEDVTKYESKMKQGYYCLQMWQFMAIFGEHTSLGHCPFIPECFAEVFDE